MNERAEEIAELMTGARRNTLALFDLVYEQDLRASPGFGFRPIMWHLAHIPVFEAYWILQKIKGDASPDERYERLFDPIRTPREKSNHLPSRIEMERYGSKVRAAVLRFIETEAIQHAHPLLHDWYVFHMLLQHEYQHQETIAYLLQLLDVDKKCLTAASNAVARPAAPSLSDGVRAEKTVLVPGGEIEVGAGPEGFAYDNEFPRHSVYVAAFEIDKALVTNAEYAEFIAAGGYENRAWWSADGWTSRTRANWCQPLYWQRHGSDWIEQQMFATSELALDLPVTGISWYEAEAYAAFAHKRLPTELEWERAAAWDAQHARRTLYAWGDELPDGSRANYNFDEWGRSVAGTYRAGTGGAGCFDLTGNLWEWTTTTFAGYEGFEPYPYPEYSQEWFDGDHKVLKGGSWATRAPLLRSTFRNFFRRDFRIAFAGVRCVKDGV